MNRLSRYSNVLLTERILSWTKTKEDMQSHKMSTKHFNNIYVLKFWSVVWDQIIFKTHLENSKYEKKTRTNTIAFNWKYMDDINLYCVFKMISLSYLRKINSKVCMKIDMFGIFDFILFQLILLCNVVCSCSMVVPQPNTTEIYIVLLSHVVRKLHYDVKY